MEFDGQLSITDIFNLTYKELDILRAHRRKHVSAYRATKQAAGFMGPMPAPQVAPVPENQNAKMTPPNIPGKYNHA